MLERLIPRDTPEVTALLRDWAESLGDILCGRPVEWTEERVEEILDREPPTHNLGYRERGRIVLYVMFKVSRETAWFNIIAWPTGIPQRVIYRALDDVTAWVRANVPEVKVHGGSVHKGHAELLDWMRAKDPDADEQDMGGDTEVIRLCLDTMVENTPSAVTP